MGLTTDQIETRLDSLRVDIDEIKGILTTLQTKINAQAVGLVIESKLQELEEAVAALQAEVF